MVNTWGNPLNASKVSIRDVIETIIRVILAHILWKNLQSKSKIASHVNNLPMTKLNRNELGLTPWFISMMMGLPFYFMVPFYSCSVACVQIFYYVCDWSWDSFLLNMSILDGLHTLLNAFVKSASLLLVAY